MGGFRRPPRSHALSPGGLCPPRSRRPVGRFLSYCIGGKGEVQNRVDRMVSAGRRRIAARLGLESSLHSQGRPRKIPEKLECSPSRPSRSHPIPPVALGLGHRHWAVHKASLSDGFVWFFAGGTLWPTFTARAVSGPAEHYPNKWRDGVKGLFGGDSARVVTAGASTWANVVKRLFPVLAMR